MSHPIVVGACPNEADVGLGILHLVGLAYCTGRWVGLDILGLVGFANCIGRCVRGGFR